MHRAIFMALLALASPARALSLHRNRTVGHTGSSVSLHKRLHVNDLITEPGTVEIDWSNLYSYTTGSFTMPSALKWTPAGNSLLWGRTEYSVAFDSVSSAVDTGARSTQFSDRVSLAATSVVYDSEHFDVAIAPQATWFLRGDSGVRMGATAIARYDGGGNSIGVTLGWSGASSTSETNPAGVWDFGAGYGRKLPGHLSHFTPHANVVVERSTGFPRTTAVFGGMECQITERVAIDASGQRFRLTGGGPDRQVLVGMTVNLGHSH